MRGARVCRARNVYRLPKHGKFTGNSCHANWLEDQSSFLGRLTQDFPVPLLCSFPRHVLLFHHLFQSSITSQTSEALFAEAKTANQEIHLGGSQWVWRA